jgi:hypothetical protein
VACLVPSGGIASRPTTPNDPGESQALSGRPVALTPPGTVSPNPSDAPGALFLASTPAGSTGWDQPAEAPRAIVMRQRSGRGLLDGGGAAGAGEGTVRCRVLSEE